MFRNRKKKGLKGGSQGKGEGSREYKARKTGVLDITTFLPNVFGTYRVAMRVNRHR